MAEVDVAGEVIRLSFEAKKRQYRDCPDFRLSEAGPLLWLHGVPGWFEVDAFYARGLPPAEVIAAVRSTQPHPDHMLTLLAEEAVPAVVTDEYARLGYRRLPEPPQPLMSRLLAVGPSAVPLYEIRREQEGQDILAYSIAYAGEIACTGKCVWASPHTVYIFGMQTQPPYWRKGMAKALLDRIHADVASAGGVQSILWSSPAGLPLYRGCGYSPAVTGYAFIPAN